MRATSALGDWTRSGRSSPRSSRQPWIAEVSGSPEVARPIATHPDLLPRAQPQGTDPATLPNGLRHSPFVVGQAFLERLGLATVHVN
jgi:hypothetical protein